MTKLAKSVASRGWAAWNIEYRRIGVGGGGGGWPATFIDVAAAIDHLASVDSIDPNRVVTCGHSAGGQLALWAAARHLLPTGSPGSEVKVTVHGAISLSGLVDLGEADRLGLGGDATSKLLKGHRGQQEARYRCASPADLLPLGVAQVLIHGLADTVVPPSMSQNYQVKAHGAGDEARYIPLENVGHREIIDADGPGWTAAMSELEGLVD
jgi:acetyl esterase/lipase